MMVNSTAQFLAKIISIALLGAVSKTWAFGYIVGDIVLFLLYTLVRNDFFYYFPFQSYIGSIGSSLLLRIADKVRKCLEMDDVAFYIHSLTDLFICNKTIGHWWLHSFDTNQERFWPWRPLLECQPYPVTSLCRRLHPSLPLVLQGWHSRCAALPWNFPKCNIDQQHSSSSNQINRKTAQNQRRNFIHHLPDFFHSLLVEHWAQIPLDLLISRDWSRKSKAVV